MKKVLCVCLCLLLIGTFAGCGNGKYRLTVNNSAFLMEKPKHSYAAGEEVVVKVNMLLDADLVVSLDDVPLEKTVCTDVEHRTYWEYRFIMPEHDCVLTVKTKVIPEVSGSGDSGAESEEPEESDEKDAPDSGASDLPTDPDDMTFPEPPILPDDPAEDPV